MISQIVKILKDEEAGLPIATLVKKIQSTPEGSNLESLPETVRRELEKAAKQGLLEFKDDIAKLLPASTESCPGVPNSGETSSSNLEVATAASQPEVASPDFQEPAVDAAAVAVANPARPDAAIRRASTRVRTVPPRFLLQEDSLVEGRRPGRQRRTAATGRTNRHQPASRSRSRSARRVRSTSRGRAGNNRN